MKLSSLISEGLVLQRGKDNYIWGSECEPGKEIKVSLSCGIEGSDIADVNGDFKVVLKNIPAGGPYKLTIDEIPVGCTSTDALSKDAISIDGNAIDDESMDKISIEEVYCGDVFLLSGQSNMEIPLQRCLDMYEDEIRQMNLPYIHYFEVAKEYGFGEPTKDIFSGRWLPATQENLYPMSALGIFFARLAHEDEQVPMGLIQTGVGGTHIESYLSEEHVINIGKMLRKEAAKRGEDISSCNCDKNNSCKVCYETLLKQDKDADWIARTGAAEMKAQQDWCKSLDAIDEGKKNHWEQRTSLYDDASQIKYTVAPGLWENQDEDHKELETLRGSAWVLKRFEVPDEWLDKEVRLYMGTLVDSDETYVNGTLVGTTGYRYPPRRYRIPVGVLHKGENTIVIRIVANARSGGFMPEAPYCLSIEGNIMRRDIEAEVKAGTVISLEGEWEYRIGGNKHTSLDKSIEEMHDVTFFTWKPTAMYNRMVYPLRNMHFKGVLFYQGESNCSHAWEYEYLMIDMVKCFRELFDEELPFGFVQLPKFGGEDDSRGTSQWDDLRDAQARAAKQIPNSVIADIYDLGFEYELHPQTKKAAAQMLYGLMKELLYK